MIMFLMVRIFLWRMSSTNVLICSVSGCLITCREPDIVRNIFFHIDDDIIYGLVNPEFMRTLWRQDSIKNRLNLSRCLKVGETVLQKYM
jgi:hypothetical protein